MQLFCQHIWLEEIATEISEKAQVRNVLVLKCVSQFIARKKKISSSCLINSALLARKKCNSEVPFLKAGPGEREKTETQRKHAATKLGKVWFSLLWETLSKAFGCSYLTSSVASLPPWVLQLVARAPSSSRTECFRQCSQKIPTTKSPNEGLISTVCPKERILDPQKRCEVLKACWKRCRDGKPRGPGEQRKPYRSPSFLMWLLGEEGWLPGINTQGREGGKEIYFRCKFTCVKRKEREKRMLDKYWHHHCQKWCGFFFPKAATNSFWAYFAFIFETSAFKNYASSQFCQLAYYVLIICMLKC